MKQIVATVVERLSIVEEKSERQTCTKGSTQGKQTPIAIGLENERSQIL